jgi:hypothetical protein
MFAGHIYGKTGYPYIIDDKGSTRIQIHLKDNVSIAADKYGTWPHCQNDMIQGKEALTATPSRGQDGRRQPLTLGNPLYGWDNLPGQRVYGHGRHHQDADQTQLATPQPSCVS